MSTFNITQIKALKENQKCWGCGDELLKGSPAILHLERGAGKGTEISKSYWCEICKAYSEKFDINYEIEEGEFKESPLYKRFRADWKKKKIKK